MNYEEFRKILTPELKGAYVFYGDEDYLKRDAVERARKAIIADESLEDFCHCVIHEGDIKAAKEELSYPTMFSNDRLIELYGVEPDKIKDADFTELCEAMKSAECLFIVYIDPGKLNEFERSKSKKEKKDKENDESSEESKKSRFQRISESGVLVEFKRQDQRKLSRWIIRHFEVKGIEASPDTALYMISFCSSDMFILKNEIDKLISFALEKNIKEIDRSHVNYISSRFTEIGAFDFANAILAGNKSAAFNILADMKMRKEPAQMVLASVSKIASELLSVKTMLEAGMNSSDIGIKLKMKDYPLRLRIESVKKKTADEVAALSVKCFEADMALKMGGADAYTVLENLILYI